MRGIRPINCGKGIRLIHFGKGVWPNTFGKGLLLGGFVAVLVTLLLGAVRNEHSALPVAILDSGENKAIPLSNSGRYQIVTWETAGGYGAFVLDTATGVTKTAYSSVKGANGKIVNNLGKPFAQMD